MGKVILTSSGLRNDCIIEILKRESSKAVIIPTADNETKNYFDALTTRELLHELKYSVDFFDIENDKETKNLLNYDLVYLAGGNPLYLMHYLKQCDAKKTFLELLKNEKIIVGTSAGAGVLGPTIELVTLFGPVPEQFFSDGFSGLGLVNIVVIPHYKNLFEKMERQIQECENKLKIPHIRLNDGEAVICENGSIQRV